MNVIQYTLSGPPKSWWILQRREHCLQGVPERQSARLAPWIRTTMSHLCLPQEISDYVLDLLQNEHQTLKQCCLVSKSWAPRAQKHLLAIVEFRSPTAPAKWARTFPDPAYSPGCLARSLHVAYVEDLTNMIARNCDWFRSFSNVVRLRIWIGEGSLYFFCSFLTTPS